MAEKNGWWINVCTSHTECQSINFHLNDQPWFRWRQGAPTENDVPSNYRNVANIKISGEAEPHDRNAVLCVKYQGRNCKHMSFDAREEHRVSQTDSDQCSC